MTKGRQDSWEGAGSPGRALREDEAAMMELTTGCLSTHLLGLAKGEGLVVWRLLFCPAFGPGAWCDRNSTSAVGANPVSVVWDVGGVTSEVSWGRGNRDMRCSTLPEEKWHGNCILHRGSWPGQ